MAEIIEPNYETITAECDHCGASCIFSRIDDLADVTPISGRSVVCFFCAKEFWIKGDTVNTAYQFLIDDAREHFRAKRYMPAIASIAQAWEVFFAACAVSTYVYRPFFSVPAIERDIDELNQTSRELHEVVRGFAWYRMRNLVMHMLLLDSRPKTMADASTHIAQLAMFRNQPSSQDIFAVADARIREALEGLNNLTVGQLRTTLSTSVPIVPSAWRSSHV